MQNRAKTPREPKPIQARRPPPLHQVTLDDSITRLGLRGITTKRMFGGVCYYADGKPFSILLGEALALKLSPAQLKAGCEQGDGEVFHPGGGDFMMREYLELSDQALMDEERVDTYVLASYRFVSGQETSREELTWSDLLQGREGLYKRAKGKRS